MDKEEFTKPLQQKLNNLSDAKLIEEMDNGTCGAGEVYREVIKAILDVRAKEATEKLNKSIEKLDKNTARYSKVLIWLTLLLFIIAFIQVIILFKTVSSSDWVGVGLTILLAAVIYFVSRKFEKEIINKN